MSTTTLSRLPSVSELEQLLQTAFPMHPTHWQNHVRALGLSRDLPPEELARVTEHVFWIVRQMGIKDPATWLANRARLNAVGASAARVEPKISPNIRGDCACEVEASQPRVDVAKNSDASLPASANRTTKVQPLSQMGGGVVRSKDAELAPPIDAESSHAAAQSEPNGDTSLGNNWKVFEGAHDEAVLINAPLESSADSMKSTSAPTALTDDFPAESVEVELAPRAEAVLGESLAEAAKAEATGRNSARASKKQKIPAASSSNRKRMFLMRQVLEYLTTRPNLSTAARRVGIHPKTVAFWLKLSKAGDPGYELVWRGFRLPFHEHCKEAKSEARGELLAIAFEWTRERIVYKLDPLAVSLGFEGRDAYLRDDKGYPIVEAVLHCRPKMIRWVLETVWPEKWGRQAVSSQPGVEESIRTRQWQAIKDSLDKDD
jgi:hypothetical protein